MVIRHAEQWPHSFAMEAGAGESVTFGGQEMCTWSVCCDAPWCEELLRLARTFLNCTISFAFGRNKLLCLLSDVLIQFAPTNNNFDKTYLLWPFWKVSLHLRRQLIANNGYVVCLEGRKTFSLINMLFLTDTLLLRNIVLEIDFKEDEMHFSWKLLKLKYLIFTRCTSMKCGFVFKEKNIIFGRMIKSALFKVCSIACYTFFPTFGQIVNTTPVKSLSFAANHSSSHFFTSLYEAKRYPASAWPIDASKW